MIEALRSKQKRLLSAVKSVPYIREEIASLECDDRLVALVGSRGVGKTTLLLQYAARCELEEVLYFSADDLMVEEYGIYAVVDEFYRLGGRRVLIDEVHMYQAWAKHLKNIYDTFPDLLVRISGSSMLNILFESHDLSRRMVVERLKGLSFREFLNIELQENLKRITFNELLAEHETISYDFCTTYPVYKKFNEYLRLGYYPFYRENPETFGNKLFNAIEKVLYEDIPASQRIKFENISVFKKLLFKIVSARVPFKVNAEALARELGISEPTLYSYFDILDRTGLFRSVRKASKKRSKKPEKLYFDNSNLLYTLARRYDIPVEVGTVRETFFVAQFEEIYYSDIGDFVFKEYFFEVGGKGKSFRQIADRENAFLVVDTDFTSHPQKIPLWLFGFLR